MGQTGSGETPKITALLGQNARSNLQGEIIESVARGCAGLFKPYAFTAGLGNCPDRTSIDVMDALGSNIRDGYQRPRKVIALPARNPDGHVNEEWISDKPFGFLVRSAPQRSGHAYFANGTLRKSRLARALAACRVAMKGQKVGALIGDLASVEATYAFEAVDREAGAALSNAVRMARSCCGANRSGYVGTATAKSGHGQAYVNRRKKPAVGSPVCLTRVSVKPGRVGRTSPDGPAVDLTMITDHLGDSPSL